MIKKITLFVLGFFSISQAQAQLDYYILGYNSQFYVEGQLEDMDTVTYQYDDEERLLRIEGLDVYSIYSYDGNIVTSDRYNKYDNALSSRRVEVLNEDGFRVVYSIYNAYGNDLELVSLDSFTRNENNQIVKSVSYDDNGYGFEKDIEENTVYTSSGNVLSIETNFYYDGEIAFILNSENTYDAQDNIERTIRETEEILSNVSYSDTTFFYYEGDDLLKSESKDYGPYGFNRCTVNEYEIDEGLRSSTRSYSQFLDCSDPMLDRLNERLSNDDILFGLESSETFIYNEDNAFEITSSINYTQEGILGDDNISLKSIQISYVEEMENFRFIRNSDYKKSQLVDVNNIDLEQQFLVYPNIVTSNNLVQYKADGVEFDNIKIVELTGQTVMHKAVVNKQNLFINSPNLPGMYYVQLYKGKTPVTKAAQLIVK